MLTNDELFEDEMVAILGSAEYQARMQPIYEERAYQELEYEQTQLGSDQFEYAEYWLQDVQPSDGEIAHYQGRADARTFTFNLGNVEGHLYLDYVDGFCEGLRHMCAPVNVCDGLDGSFSNVPVMEDFELPF